MNYNQSTPKTAVVTGGAHGIGRCIAEEFRKAGVRVFVIDKAEGDHYVGDISDKKVLEDFAAMVTRESGGIDCLINNALPLMKGIDDCSYEEFQYALSVGVTAPFYLAKLFAPHFREGASIVNISSSRDRMSQPQTESYTAAKGGIASLTHALAASFAGKVRVNSVSPGWIDTDYRTYEGPDALQQPAGRVGNPMDIANMVLFLCSDKAGFITGENICIDGGMTRLMVYHGDCGWSYEPPAADKELSAAAEEERIQSGGAE
ncbi:MAG: SDR family oxidoreductase [Clostridium sp.]|nr:SDR family oxidoreductase [Clostridium sp.]